MLPTFLIIGAPKCGTTSLHHYLRQHPEISMPKRKELNFFSHESWRERVAWYEAWFETGRTCGEASTSYSMHPVVPGVPERVHALVPEARLIYLVRDPIERLVAHHAEWVWRGFESRSLERSLRTLEPSNPYICSSMYASQLAEYRRFFPRERILVLDDRDLLERREGTLAAVFDFLGVAPEFSSPEFARTLNVRGTKVHLNRVGRTLAKRRVLRGRFVGPAIRGRGRVARLVASAVARPDQSPPPLSAPMRRRLTQLFRADAAELRSETGKAFSTWPV